MSYNRQPVKSTNITYQQKKRMEYNRKRAQEVRDLRRQGSNVRVMQYPRTLSTISVRDEIKYVDGFYNNATITSLETTDTTWASTEIPFNQATTSYGALPIPQQGDNMSDRNGRKIVVKNIKIKGIITMSAIENQSTGQKVSPVIRLILVQDNQTNGTQLSGEDVIGQAFGSDGNPSKSADCALMSFSKPTGWGRYKICKDKLIRVPFRSPTHDGNKKIKKKLNDNKK